MFNFIRGKPCCLKALQRYSRPAWERTQKGRSERQKALFPRGGRRGFWHRHKRQDKGRIYRLSLRAGGGGGGGRPEARC